MSTVGIIGLGNMGRGMATALIGAGFQVATVTRSSQSRSRPLPAGLEVRGSMAALLAQAEVVLLSLPDPQTVVQVVEGPDGIRAHGRAGLIVIDTTTSEPASTRRIAADLAERNISFVDAPVSGAPALAHQGKLTVMAGGTPAQLERAGPVLNAIAARVFHVGPSGAGHMAKLANNLMAAAHLLVAEEVVALAEAAGMERARFLEIVNASSGRSFVTERVYPDWILDGRFDLGFSIRLMRKDVRLAIQAAQRMPVFLPMVAAAATRWLDNSREIDDDEDVTFVAELTRRRMQAEAT